MLAKTEIENVHFSLTVNDEQVLAIRFAKSGALNRMGDGSDDPKARIILMKRVEEPIFDQLIAALSDELLALVGRYSYPDPQGDLSKLLITLEGSEDKETGFEFVYGADSVGPPEEIIDFVEYAVELSDPYWEEYLASKRQPSRKS